jgi:hypothetical protein
MATPRKSVLNEIGGDLRKLHRANAEYGDIVREFDYPPIREAARWPPVRTFDALMALPGVAFFLCVQLPLYGLKRLGVLEENAVMLVRDGLDADFRTNASAVGDALWRLLEWAAFWLGLALRCVGVELKIAGVRAFIWLLVGLGYAALALLLFWAFFYLLFYWP